MSSSSGTYDPKYTALEDVPMTTIIDYGREERLDAIERAESVLETDVNDGAVISEKLRKPIHAEAVENLATYRLIRHAAGPGEADYGAVADYGERQLEYVSTYREEYDRLVEKINAADPTEVGGGDDTSDDEPGGGYNPPFEFDAV